MTDMIDTIRHLLKNRRKQTAADADTDLYLIVGLGNPEKKYDGTRHNAGFSAIDILAEEYAIPYGGTQKKAATGKGMIGGKKVMLAKPLTYMNLSGEAVRALCDYYKIDTQTHLIVVSDDIYLDVGCVRVRKKGSAGGHNGLKNIIRHLGNENFIRVRIGVGNRDAGSEMVNHVLSGVSPSEREAFEAGIARGAKAAAAVVENGADYAMNTYNAKPKESEN